MTETRDPFAPIEASPRGATALVVAAGLLGLTAMLGGLSPVTGPLGMLVGLVAHVKGHRLERLRCFYKDGVSCELRSTRICD